MRPKRRVHFVGIGGVGMSGIAQILLNSGYEVSGSDLRENHETRRLAELGARIYQGHQASHVSDADTVVFSSAVASNNPELQIAREKGILLLARAEMLAELMRKKQSIAVAGAHGKTTTTALIANMMMDAGCDPTAVVGGKLNCIASNAKLGTDGWFVCESDESDGSFLKLLPHIAVITNIDEEHLSHYGSFDHLKQAFVDFANRVPFDGLVVACLDNSHVAELIEKVEHPTTTYGFSDACDVRATNVSMDEGRARFTVERKGEDSFQVSLPLVGRHNVLNALAAVSVGFRIGLSPDAISKGLGAFEGIGRRLEKKGEVRGICVVDDYAHHPTEICATVSALKAFGSYSAIRVLFQPHRYTRMRDLWTEFLSAFDGVDELIVAPIYEASEQPIEGVTSDSYVEQLSKRGTVKASSATSIDQGVDQLVKNSKRGDLIVTMGAGDITNAGAKLLERLQIEGAL